MPFQYLDEGMRIGTKKNARDDGVTPVFGGIDQAVVPALKEGRLAVEAVVILGMKGFVKESFHGYLCRKNNYCSGRKIPRQGID